MDITPKIKGNNYLIIATTGFGALHNGKFILQTNNHTQCKTGRDKGNFVSACFMIFRVSF